MAAITHTVVTIICKQSILLPCLALNDFQDDELVFYIKEIGRHNKAKLSGDVNIKFETDYFELNKIAQLYGAQQKPAPFGVGFSSYQNPVSAIDFTYPTSYFS